MSGSAGSGRWLSFTTTRILRTIEGNGVTVKMRELGRTGMRVRPSRPGTMMYGRPAGTDQDDRVRTIHRAPDSGIAFVDIGERAIDAVEQAATRARRGRSR